MSNTATLSKGMFGKISAGNKSKWILRGVQGLFALAMTGSALGKITQSEQLVQAFNHLGYPQYLLSILGVAYLMGVVGILQNKVPVLKEWAYAGLTFGLLGGFLSHLFSGDPLGVAFPPLMLLIVMFGVYFFEKRLQNN